MCVGRFGIPGARVCMHPCTHVWAAHRPGVWIWAQASLGGPVPLASHCNFLLSPYSLWRPLTNQQFHSIAASLSFPVISPSLRAPGETRGEGRREREEGKLELGYEPQGRLCQLGAVPLQLHRSGRALSWVWTGTAPPSGGVRPCVGGEGGGHPSL